VVVASGVASLLAADVMRAWLVPALIFLIVLIVAGLGVRWIRSEHLDTIASIPLFSGLPRNRLMAVLRSAHSVDVPAGSDIVTEGERGKGFFMIAKGTAVIEVGGNRRGTLSPGAYFGDVAAIDGLPRSATITAESRVSTLEIPPSAFRSLLKQESSVARAISAELNRRLGTSGSQTDTALVEDPDLASLEALCARLRAGEHPEWTQSEMPRRSALWRLRSLFS
jgi:CRP/FNR family transcriptional regulator, cyclic AMP receptor protein